MKQLQRENGKVNPVVNNPAEKNMSSADVAPHTETESANFETPPEISSISGGNEYNAAEIFPDYDVIDQSELADFEEDTQIPVSILGSLNETTVAKSGTLQEVKPDSTSPDQEENEGKENLTFFTVFATATLILLVHTWHWFTVRQVSLRKCFCKDRSEKIHRAACLPNGAQRTFVN
ncbi:hypothetical protein ACTXT7_013540 [Hymenolepis weldensis]